MALTDLATVKAQTGIASGDTSRDAWITALLAPAEAAVKQYCGREFAAAAATEFYTGANTPKLVLRRYPVASVASVYEARNGFYGANDYGTALVAGTDYSLDLEGVSSGSTRGLLVRLNGVWHEDGLTTAFARLVRPAGPAWGNVKVTYTAGSAPDDVKYAVALTVSQMMRSAPYGGMTQREKIGRYEVEFAQARSAAAAKIQEFADIRRLLSTHVDVPLA